MSNERSTRRRSVIAFAILLPLVLWMSAHEDFANARQSHATDAINAIPEQAVSFAGVNWRLLDLKTATTPATPETTQVEARLLIDVTSPEIVQSLRGCRSYLEDSTGQRWSAQPPRRGEAACARLPTDMDSSGKQVEIVERFLVPTRRATDVNLAIVIPKLRPQYLRFQRW